MNRAIRRYVKGLLRRSRPMQEQIDRCVRASDPYLELERTYQELLASHGRLENQLEQRITDVQSKGGGIALGNVLRGYHDTVDREPWRHPFLSRRNIVRFRQYSNEVWRFALDYRERHPVRLNCAFLTNLAQNMYKWARLAQEAGARATVVLNPMDETALSRPEWEEFDGEYRDIFDGPGFLAAHRELQPVVPCARIPIRPDAIELAMAYRAFCLGDRGPLLRLMAAAPGMRHEPLLTYAGFHTYFDLSRALTAFDVIYAASVPFAAYFSGRPYCAFSVGGDLIWDCGRSDDWGRALTLSFNAARFLLVSNPHTLGHSRRLGLANGVYLPYPMDDHRYVPGEGAARREWEARCGPGVFVLTTARLDEGDKGYGDEFVAMLADVTRRRADLRFVFLSWGVHAERFQDRVRAAAFSDRIIFLAPAGKQRLLDYYRSCDVVLDHLVYGYYGATALEAASIGKPVIMKLRTEHYDPLYEGDVAPVHNAGDLRSVGAALAAYAQSPALRCRDGAAMRDWLVRTHGHDRTVPLMLALLQLTADQVPLPSGLQNPLSDALDDEEDAYHRRCLSVAAAVVE